MAAAHRFMKLYKTFWLQRRFGICTQFAIVVVAISWRIMQSNIFRNTIQFSYLFLFLQCRRRRPLFCVDLSVCVWFFSRSSRSSTSITNLLWFIWFKQRCNLLRKCYWLSSTIHFFSAVNFDINQYMFLVSWENK